MTDPSERGCLRAILWIALGLSIVAGVTWLITAWLFRDALLLRGLDSEDVRFVSRDVTLAGTLVLPGDTEPVAVLVVIHGSGRQKRLLPLAAALARGGVAVFTYDKRGVGDSGGTFGGTHGMAAEISPVNLSVLADDAAAAAALVARHPQTSGLPVGLLGLSQGGWIGPLAAVRAPEVVFMTYWAGPICTASEELHFSDLAEDVPDFWEHHTQADVDAHMRSVRSRPDDFDPRDSLSRLSIPGLWLFGGRDQSIPVALSVRRIDGMRSVGHHRFEYRVYPALGHADIDEGVLRDLADWIKANAGS